MREKFVTLAASSGNPIDPEMNPNEQPAPGSPTTGENVCPKCGGSGIRDDGARCDHCGGSGKLIDGVIAP